MSPGWSGISACEIWVPVVTVVPLIAVITSPAARPALAAAVPASAPELDPILLNVPLQLLAYRVAQACGTDIDQPRNLAKSVTVE